MVARTFELPDLGEGIAEGELVSWLVGPGDVVEENQVIAEVETDKALVEIPSPQEGTITELHYDEGDIVPVDAVIVTFEVEDEGVDVDASAGSDQAETGASQDDTPDVTADSGADDSETGVSPGGDADRTDAETEPAVASARVFATPSTRTLARELGVDISAVNGSGPGGRVSASDVRAAVGDESPDRTTEPPAGQNQEAGADAIDETAVSAAETHTIGSTPLDSGDVDRDRTLAMPATRRLAAESNIDLNAVPASEEREGEPYVTPEDVRAYADTGAAAASASSGAEGVSPDPTNGTAGASGTATGQAGGEGSNADTPGERIPYRGVRRTIGEQMAQSKYTAPHVSHHDEFDATSLVALREELAAAVDGVNLTYLPFVVKAITAALAEYPYLNASLDEEREEIVLHDEYNIGIAVSTDAGLMVPVIDDADQKGLERLATEITDLADRARARKIKPEEMQGGTFTITNIGAIGGEFSSPIINHPEAAIFAMGPIKKRPWVVDDEVCARKTMRFSMSVDHRLVDGADAARFSNRIKELLVEPTRLLLE
jgi:pyruvate dehydrogenase E2 component (dihydrolipoamide acetyltransferase)